MKRNTFHVLFFVKRSRVAKNGEFKIITFSVDGNPVRSAGYLIKQPE